MTEVTATPPARVAADMTVQTWHVIDALLDNTFMAQVDAGNADSALARSCWSAREAGWAQLAANQIDAGDSQKLTTIALTVEEWRTAVDAVSRSVSLTQASGDQDEAVLAMAVREQLRGALVIAGLNPHL